MIIGAESGNLLHIVALNLPQKWDLCGKIAYTAVSNLRCFGSNCSFGLQDVVATFSV